MVHKLIWKLTILITSILLSYSALAAYDPNRFDPENAAHWYLRAFAHYEEPDEINLPNYALGEGQSTPEIEAYLEKQQPVLRLVMQASKIDRCDWQYTPQVKLSKERLDLLDKAKEISFLLLAKARYDKDQGLQENLCNTFDLILQLAARLDTDLLLDHLASSALRSMTYDAIHQYLYDYPNMPLTELYRAKQLLEDESAQSTVSYKDTVIREIENVRVMLTDYQRYVYSEPFLVKQMGVPAEQLSEDFYRRNLLFYNGYMAQYLSYLDLPYPEACRKITELGEELKAKARLYFLEYRDQLEEKAEDYLSEVASKFLKDEFDSASIANFEPRLLGEIDVEYLEKCDFLFCLLAAAKTPTTLSVATRIGTKLNALKAAVPILIRYRKTNTIPDPLPPASPHDLFSDKPFPITRTSEGFKLKCRGEDWLRKEVYEYEFVLPQN